MSSYLFCNERNIYYHIQIIVLNKRGNSVVHLISRLQQHTFTSGDFLHICISFNNIHFDIMIIYRYPSYKIVNFMSDFTDFTPDFH